MAILKTQICKSTIEGNSAVIVLHDTDLFAEFFYENGSYDYILEWGYSFSGIIDIYPNMTGYCDIHSLELYGCEPKRQICLELKEDFEKIEPDITWDCYEEWEGELDEYTFNWVINETLLGRMSEKCCMGCTHFSAQARID